jgi:DNA-directed RNA polymerase specialized sigma24 family protein
VVEGGRPRKTAKSKVAAASPRAHKAVTKRQSTKRQSTKRQPAKGKAANPTGSFRLRGELRGPAPTVGPRAQRTTALLMDTARDVFLAKGYFGLRIDDIADAAGMSRA